MTKHDARAIAIAIIALALAAGCSGSGAQPASSRGATSLLSDSGALQLTLRSSPDTLPVRGDNQIDLTIARADTGEPVTGLSLSMVPFMPVMGHGSPVVPQFSDEGAGAYRFDDVVLTMPGLWELRTTIDGAESDTADFRFDVN